MLNKLDKKSNSIQQFIIKQKSIDYIILLLIKTGISLLY